MDVPSEQLVFFIRHAESRWNRAQASGDLIGLLWENDHGLTEDGLRMATALRQRIRAAREAPSGVDAKAEWARHFMRPDAVFSSPLTRALETTCLALKDVIATRGVVVMREAREQKNSIGSVDSTGVAVGERIRDRVQEDLRAVLEAACEGTGETPEAPADRALADAWESLEALANLPLDTSGVEDEWWGPLSGDHEAIGTTEMPREVSHHCREAVEAPRMAFGRKTDLDERVQAFFERLRLTRGTACRGGGGTAIVVGHSHFLRTVFGAHLADCPPMSSDSWKFNSLRKRVLPYCAVMGCRIRWDQDGQASIVEAVPLFGTELSADIPSKAHGGGCVCGRGQIKDVCVVS